MSTSLLSALMSGSTLEETLNLGAKKIKRIGKNSTQRTFSVTIKDGFVVTKLYPNSKPSESVTPKLECEN